MKKEFIFAFMFILLIGSVIAATDAPESTDWDVLNSQIKDALKEQGRGDIKLNGLGDASKASFDAEKGVINYNNDHVPIEVFKNLKGAEVDFQKDGRIRINYAGDVAEIPKALAEIKPGEFVGQFSLNVKKSDVIVREGFQLKRSAQQLTNLKGFVSFVVETAVGQVPVVGQIGTLDSLKGVMDTDRMQSEGILSISPESDAMFRIGGEKGQEFSVAAKEKILIIPSGLGESGTLDKKENKIFLDVQGDKLKGYTLSGAGFDALIPDSTDKTGKTFYRYKLGNSEGNTRGEVAFSSNAALSQDNVVNINDLRVNHIGFLGDVKAGVGDLFASTGKIDISKLEKLDLGAGERLGDAASWIDKKLDLKDLNPLNWNVGSIFHSDKKAKEQIALREQAIKDQERFQTGVVPPEQETKVEEISSSKLPIGDSTTTRGETQAQTAQSTSIVKIENPEGTSLYSGNEKLNAFMKENNFESPQDVINYAYNEAGWNGQDSDYAYAQAAKEIDKLGIGYSMNQLVQMRKNEETFSSSLTQATTQAELEKIIPAAPVSVSAPPPIKVNIQAGENAESANQRGFNQDTGGINNGQGNYQEEISRIGSIIDDLNPTFGISSNRAGYKPDVRGINVEGNLISGGLITHFTPNSNLDRMGGGDETASGVAHSQYSATGIKNTAAVNTRYISPGTLFQLINTKTNQVSDPILATDVYGSSFYTNPDRLVDVKTNADGSSPILNSIGVKPSDGVYSGIVIKKICRFNSKGQCI